MTAFIEDYRIDTLTRGEEQLCDGVPAWVQQRPAAASARVGTSVRRSAGTGSARRRGGSDRTRVRTARRPSNGRPGGVPGASRRPNTWRTSPVPAPGHGVSNIGHVRGGRSVVRGPVQGVRRNATSMAIVAGIGAAFGLMLHFSGLGAPMPDTPPTPTYVGASSTPAETAAGGVSK